jgi:hypothetical protein
MDKIFDMTGISILIFHLFLSFYAVPYELFPAWLAIALFFVTRTALAAVGHYHSHRKKDGITDWGDAFFDI